MNNNDNFGNSYSPNNVPAKPSADYSSFPEPKPEDAQVLPGNQREDASQWDRFSDAQRKIIVFGALIVVLLLLVLFTSIANVCGGCQSCGADTSASDVTDDAQTVPDNQPIAESTSDSDAAAQNPPLSACSHSSGNEVTATDSIGESSDPGVAAPDNTFDSGSDSSSREQEETVQDSPFSSCNHQADNEAGNGTTSTRTGFLSFLFGCMSCADSCSISCADSLTDPVSDGDLDSDFDRLGITSGSDADEEIWPTQTDDESYIAMLSDQWFCISEFMIRLGELDIALAQYTDPQSVRSNDRFRDLYVEILTWCQGAEEYRTDVLVGQQALNCNAISVRLAGHLRTYLDGYPELITGATSGTDIVAKDEQINTIMSDLVDLYTALNTVPAEN